MTTNWKIDDDSFSFVQQSFADAKLLGLVTQQRQDTVHSVEGSDERHCVREQIVAEAFGFDEDFA